VCGGTIGPCRSALSPRSRLAALDDGSIPLGYYVSQHVKVMDAIEAAADNPKVTASPGPTLGDFLVPALRRGSDHSGRTIPLYRSAKADPGRRFHALRDKVIAETSCGGRGPRCAATTAHRASTRPPWPMSRSTAWTGSSTSWPRT